MYDYSWKYFRISQLSFAQNIQGESRYAYWFPSDRETIVLLMRITTSVCLLRKSVLQKLDKQNRRAII